MVLLCLFISLCLSLALFGSVTYFSVSLLPVRLRLWLHGLE